MSREFTRISSKEKKKLEQAIIDAGYVWELSKEAKLVECRKHPNQVKIYYTRLAKDAGIDAANLSAKFKTGISRNFADRIWKFLDNKKLGKLACE